MRDKRSSRRRSNKGRSPASHLLSNLMPAATQGSHSTVAPGASAHGGFGMGIPAGGGGGAAAAGGLMQALAGPPGGPSPGDFVAPGIAPPPAPIDAGIPSGVTHPFPTLPTSPTAGPTAPVNAGTWPSLPTVPQITHVDIAGRPTGQFPQPAKPKWAYY